MAGFDLDLQSVEREIEDATDGGGRVVLGVLDGETAPGEWVRLVNDGSVLVLAIEGDLNELASGFAREIRDMGGKLPALGPAGLAWPSSQVTASAGIPQICAARAVSFLIASRAARMVAIPVAKVVRLPSVTSL